MFHLSDNDVQSAAAADVVDEVGIRVRKYYTTTFTYTVEWKVRVLLNCSTLYLVH